MNKQVVPPECAKVIFKVSFLILGSFTVASILQVYDGAVVTAAVFVCSVNYWRRAEYGLRRNIDIANNVVCLSYQTWRSFQISLPYTIGFLVPTYIGVGCFFLGRYLDKTDTTLGTWAHAWAHIFGNIGNVILYHGIKFSSLSEQ